MKLCDRGDGRELVEMVETPGKLTSRGSGLKGSDLKGTSVGSLGRDVKASRRSETTGVKRLLGVPIFCEQDALAFGLTRFYLDALGR